jgi:hypothetical protein
MVIDMACDGARWCLVVVGIGVVESVLLWQQLLLDSLSLLLAISFLQRGQETESWTLLSVREDQKQISSLKL